MTFIVMTVIIDSMGIGIIMPVMPDLLRELADTDLSEAALWGGYLSFVYALMQFVFGPTLGNLSDRFGRRSVLLSSLAALSVDYLIMAFAPNLLWLFIGRLLAGIAGATYATANAVVADISEPDKRAERFGMLGAAFGIGFILGPLIGGLVADFGTRAPFFAAAVLAAMNFLYGYWVMPETQRQENRRRFDFTRANPFGAARQLTRVPMVAWFVAAVFLFDVAHHVYPVIWSFYTKAAFAWSNREIGLSLAAVGVGFAIVQGGLIRVFLKHLGDVRTTLAGFGFNIAALAFLAFITEGWMAYAGVPIAALGAIFTPAITALMSRNVPDDAQGELQGVLSSVLGISLILCPILMTRLFDMFTDEEGIYMPGAPFLAAALLTLLALIPFYFGLRKLQH